MVLFVLLAFIPLIWMKIIIVLATVYGRIMVLSLAFDLFIFFPELGTDYNTKVDLIDKVIIMCKVFNVPKKNLSQLCFFFGTCGENLVLGNLLPYAECN